MNGAAAVVAPLPESLVREQLQARRDLATDAPTRTRVDDALARLDAGAWGICRECHDPVESERLLVDPLIELCIDHLSSAERRALEDDLVLAARVQSRLQPPPHVIEGAWEIATHGEPARIVGGDYADIVPDGRGGILVLLGDVSGKGVAASMLAAHLHATFRSLAMMGRPLAELLGMANRLLVASTLPSQYATLAAVHAHPSGAIDVANAGHPPLLHLRPGRNTGRIPSTGMPLGLFADARVSSHQVRIERGEALVLYSDGFTEATDAEGIELGEERLAESLRASDRADPRAVLTSALRALHAYRATATDDATMLVLGAR